MAIDDLKPGEIYTIDEVATAIRVSVATVRRRVRSHSLMALPRSSNSEPLRFRGQAVMAYLGVTVATEGTKDRQRRADESVRQAKAMKR